MSDVERLERILIKSPFDQYDEKFLVDLEDMNWLVDTVEEQQKEIEQLNKAVEKEMHTGYSLEGQVHDVKEKLEKENARYREALVEISEGAGPPEVIALTTLEASE